MSDQAEDYDGEIEQLQQEIQNDEDAQIEQLANDAAGASSKTPVNGPEVDKRSVHVSNVDFSTTPEELGEFFSSCGTINRVSILMDKFTQKPKGFAYIEFAEIDSVANSLLLNDQMFKGRKITVQQKRTNVPMWKLDPSARGRGRGRGRGGMMMNPMMMNPMMMAMMNPAMMYGYGPMRGGRGGRGRGGARGGFHPYQK